MQIFLDVLVMLLKLLIFIGNLILLILSLFWALIKLIVNSISSVFRATKRKIKNFFSKITSPFRKKEITIQTPYKHKIKKVRKTKFFPLPISIKVKYFIFGFFSSLLFIFIPLLVIIFLQDLPNPGLLGIGQVQQTTKIYDRNNNLLFQIYASQNRTYIPLSSIPKDLQNATIAIEDKNFYANPGFDALAIVRAAYSDFSGQSFQGGSTITQQLIKSTLLTSEQSVQRKVKEIILAFWAQHMYTKNQILEMYFNQVPYGGMTWGAEAAAQTYFGEDVKDLDLAQSAFLAGLPKAPSVYSPYGATPNLWKQRQKDVLQRMQELGYISKDQEDQALSETLTFDPPQNPIQAPHFVMYVKDLLVQKYGLEMVEKGGLRVKTSLDLNIQNQAQNIVSDEVQKDQNLNISNGAALITDPKNGDILAMIGSKDYNDQNDGNVNLTTSLRQPGSSIKLVTYTAALSNGFTAATILDDTPVSYTSPGAPTYSPVNYDGAFHGRVPLRIAFANSFNIPAVKTLNAIGIPTMVNFAKKMGITTWKDPKNYGLSITLGAAEVKMVDMATVYGVIANEGKRVNLDPILEITDTQGNVIEKKQTSPQNVVDPGVAFIISSILSDNAARTLEFGPNSPLNIPGRTVSVKTGTTDIKRDNWTIGFTPSYLVATWVGNNDNTPMSQNLASGITGAAPMWNRIMTYLLNKKTDEKFSVPSDIVQKQCGGRQEYFMKGTENSVNCNYISSATPSATLAQ